MTHLRGLRTGMRASGLLAGCLAAGTGTWSVVSAPLRRTFIPLAEHGAEGALDVRFEDVLTASCAAVLTACVLWLLVGTLLAVASQVADELSPRSTAAAALSAAADHGWPRGLRRAVAAALGVAVVAGAAGPALADSSLADSSLADSSLADSSLADSSLAAPPEPATGQAHRTSPREGPPPGLLAGALSGLAVPDRTSGAAESTRRPAAQHPPAQHPPAHRPAAPHPAAPHPAAPHPAAARHVAPDPVAPHPVAPDPVAPDHVVRRPQGTVVVHRGDSLWSISARLLPPRATDHDISEAWHRLHRANRGRVGPDPDLILPGTPLAVPELSTADREDPS